MDCTDTRHKFATINNYVCSHSINLISNKRCWQNGKVAVKSKINTLSIN